MKKISERIGVGRQYVERQSKVVWGLMLDGTKLGIGIVCLAVVMFALAAFTDWMRDVQLLSRLFGWIAVEITRINDFTTPSFLDEKWSPILAAWTSAFIATVAVILVYATLCESRKALAITQQMADDQKKIGDRQTDAWVAVEGLVIDDVHRDNIRITFVNYGNTAAIKFGYRIDCHHVTNLNKYEPRPVNINNLTANYFISPNREFVTDYRIGTIPSNIFARPQQSIVVDITFLYETRSGRIEKGIASFNIFENMRPYGLQGMMDYLTEEPLTYTIQRLPEQSI